MNPLREIPLILMPHLPDTLLGQGLAIGAGVFLCIGALCLIAAAGVWIVEKMGYCNESE